MEKFQFDWEKYLTPIPLEKSSHDVILQRIGELEKRNLVLRLIPVSGIGALVIVVSILMVQKNTLLDFVTGSVKLGVIQPQN